MKKAGNKIGWNFPSYFLWQGELLEGTNKYIIEK